MTGHEDDRYPVIGFRELLLEIEAADHRQPDIEHQAAGRLGDALLHELLRRAEGLDLETHRPQQAAQGAAHRAVVIGPSPLYGQALISPDIRAGMALLIAALCAEGESVIDNVHQIDRGYERIEERLLALGADVRRA